MNISNNSWLINGAENSYHKFRPQIELDPTQKLPEENISISGKQQQLNQPEFPADILSVREKNTLQALFNDVSTEKSFYGAARVKNIQSGFLLDIKG